MRKLIDFIIPAVVLFTGVFIVDHLIATKDDQPKTETTSIKVDIPDFPPPNFPSGTYDILKYDADPSGKRKSTLAFASAIKKASQNGGGTVYVPEGNYLTGPIHLKSNIKLNLDKNAVIKFSTYPPDYLPPVFTRFEGMELYNFSPLIYAKDCNNVAITGSGKIIGNGQAWWHHKKNQEKTARVLQQMILEGTPPEKRIIADNYSEYLRPSFIQTVNCKNVLISDLTIKDGPMWTVHPVYSENVTIRNLKIETHGPNTDGIDIDSCSNVIIRNCVFDTDDDCIALKSGLNKDGWRVNRPTRNVFINGIYTKKGHGGIVIGSEMSGGIENVLAQNCTFNGTDRGLRIKSMKGRGGYIKNIYFRNITMNDIQKQAIRINMNYGSSTLQPKTEKPPLCKNIYYENITCKNAETAAEFIGLSHQLTQNIYLKDIDITAKKGLTAENIKNIELKNTNISAPKPIYTFHNCKNVSK